MDASYAALRGAKAAPGSVLRPYIPAPGSPDGNGWPAEGTDLWTMGAIPTANYITGPSYLLNWGIPTMDKLDLTRMRREAMAFTQMLLDLSRIPAAACAGSTCSAAELAPSSRSPLCADLRCSRCV